MELVTNNYAETIELADMLILLAARKHGANPNLGGSIFSMVVHGGGLLTRHAGGDVEGLLFEMIQEKKASFVPVLQLARQRHLASPPLSDEMLEICVADYLEMIAGLFPYVLGSLPEEKIDHYPELNETLQYFSCLAFSICALCVGQERASKIVDEVLDRLIRDHRFPPTCTNDIFNARVLPTKYRENAVIQTNSYYRSEN